MESIKDPASITKDIRLMALSLWESKIKTINRRLAKNGVPVISYSVSDPFMVSEIRLPDWHPLRSSDDRIDRPHVTITLDVTPVNVGGYRPVAVLDYGHSEPIIRAWPGEELNVQAPESPRCDYCKKIRRRLSIVVLENVEDPGSRYYVGKNCVRDFIGYDPTSMLQSAEWTIDAWLNALPSGDDGDDWGTMGNGWERRIDLGTILLYSVSAIREYAWRGRNYEDGWRTSEIVSESIWPSRSRDTYNTPPKVTILPDDRDKANAVLEYVRSLDDAAIKSDYVRNLHTIAVDGYCTRKEFNLTVSMSYFYDREMESLKARLEREAKWAKEREERAAQGKDSVFVGTIKERLTFPSVRIEFVKDIPFDGPYGPTTSELVKFVTPEGNRLAWFNSGNNSHDDLVGKDVKLTGTVKSHKEYQGIQETTLTRCRIDELK